MVKKVLIVNDLHCGSIYGLGVPNFCGLSGYTLPFTETNRFLYDRWNQMINAVGAVDLVIANGDLVEGLNKKRNGEETLTPFIKDQSNMAANLLGRITTGEYAFTGGSGYHTGQDTNGDQEVCDKLGGTWFGTDGTIEIEDIKLHVRHVGQHSKIPHSRATGLLFDFLIASLQGDNTNIFIRSHTHKFVYAGIHNRLGMTTPCWKGVDAFIRTKSMEKTDCGWVLITVDGAEYTWEHCVFQAPDITPILRI